MNEISEKLKEPYNPSNTEERIYKDWEENGLFSPEKSEKLGLVDANKESFSMVLPPPNVTGTLHTGHALMLAIEDTMVRFARMKGSKTAWIPGTDHAAIATQSVVEKRLSKEGVRKNDIGRKEFLKQVDQFAHESHSTIVNQIRRMGASVDWSREAFTLDETRQKAVVEAFKRMFEDGLIYRGDRIVNWDPKMQSTVSDDEVEYEEEKTPFYYFKYGPFTIGTARPETKFGDKYVVMHPEDERYKKYEHRQEIEVEWINGKITATIIKDEAVDPEFGTGVMTITAWHSMVDFEIAQKHELDKEQVIDEYGKLLPVAKEFEGMKILEARQKIVEKLDKKGLLVKIDESYTHRKAKNYRGGGLIEPQIKRQWFVNVNKKFQIQNSKINGVKSGQQISLKELMIHVVESGQIEILPDRFNKNYYHWVQNLHDWCISRQIWYGHRIPVWYKQESTESETEIHIGKEPPDKSDGWKQDPDTLDTWFSSGLWTFSTLGWPDKTEDLEIFHPTSVLETGYDILPFWVSRMILMSTYLLGEIPFKTAYLHGMVLDRNGKKMSKSNPETAIDPIESIEEFGSDALRMAMLVGVGPGQALTLTREKIKAYKHFGNKIWNATRFVIENCPNIDVAKKPKLIEEDQEYLKKMKEVLVDVTDDMESYRLHLASEKLYHYFWHEFADVIIEDVKERLRSESANEEEKKSGEWILTHILTENIKALHPFMPFITEEIWSILPHTQGKLIVTKWPQTGS